MKIEEIRIEIETLLSIVSQWREDEPLSHIEHDITLNKLGRIYEGVKFLSPKMLGGEVERETSVAFDSQEEADACADVSSDSMFPIDLDGVSLIADVEPAPTEDPEEEKVYMTEPEVESDVEIEPTSIQEEVEVAEDLQQEVEPVSKTDNMLFDIDIVPKQSRRRRSVLMSLYDDEISSKSESREPEEIEIEGQQQEEAVPKEVLYEPNIPIVEEPKEQPIATSSVVVGDFAAPTTTLGDILARDVETVADRFAGDNHILSISDVNRYHSFDALGINERFLLSRDLFGENPQLCRDELEVISKFDNYEDTMIYIAENYNWNPELEGVKLLLSVIENKFNID